VSAAPAELHFLLDRAGAVIAFQEKEQSWAGALAFSNEETARRFIAASRVEVAEIASIAADDQEGIAGLIAALKKRPIRYLLLDLDYRTGACRQVEFEGNRLGKSLARQFEARGHPPQ
jgi:hypothetical protein